MFVQLPNQASTEAMRVFVWSDDGNDCPFDTFLSELYKNDSQAAVFMVTHIGCIMEFGSISLESSTAITDSLRLIYAGPVWIAYFVQQSSVFICDQGLEDGAVDSYQKAQFRMLQYSKQELVYER